ncbi:N-acetyltransferase [Psychrobacillus glaciei]|uniref:N-acetyltransferase n=1 Tax=Psychrobacillus glaciei TaxID=2283160 RepID=A0A5J6SJH5_9BACI|nr:GNAT family N-acetyltransferase [Psychrobacillus glaciei]QFF98065.1 N-acetyltransferase [Psychrobacillus glaciei]
MEDINVYVDFSLDMEEGTSLFNVHAKCIIYPKGSDQAINIGQASIYLFNPVKSSYSEVCDDAVSISLDLYHALTNLESLCDIEYMRGLVATAHFINMKEEWRGKGLRQAFVEKMMQQLAILNVELIMLITNDHMEIDFYNRLGFVNLENKTDITLMYKYVVDKQETLYC